MEIVERRRKQREEVIKDASEFATSLPIKCTVLLIGSYARGDFNIWSDVDLLIIGHFVGNPLERLKAIDLPAGYEAILLTPDEFTARSKKNDRLIRESLLNGVVLRDDFSLMNKDS